MASAVVYTWRQVYLEPSGRIRLVEGLAETLLAYGAILSGFGKLLGWVESVLIISRILSWSPFSIAFISSRSGDTVLLGVSSCIVSFIGSAKSLNIVV